MFTAFLTFIMYSLSEFQIRSMNGHTMVYEIASLDKLVEFIRSEGLEGIAKVSFYFQDPVLPFHNLILRQEDGRLTPEFMPREVEEGCGGVDILMDVIAETRERRDIKLVLDAIYGIPELVNVFGQYIDNPYEV